MPRRTSIQDHPVLGADHMHALLEIEEKKDLKQSARSDCSGFTSELLADDRKNQEECKRIAANVIKDLFLTSEKFAKNGNCSDEEEIERNKFLFVDNEFNCNHHVPVYRNYSTTSCTSSGVSSASMTSSCDDFDMIWNSDLNNLPTTLTLNVDGNTKTHHCPYPNCKKSYFRKFELTRHVDSFHKKIKPHVCDVCDKPFGRLDHLKQHRRSHFKEKFQCRICKKGYCSEVTLKKHVLRKHPRQ